MSLHASVFVPLIQHWPSSTQEMVGVFLAVVVPSSVLCLARGSDAAWIVSNQCQAAFLVAQLSLQAIPLYQPGGSAQRLLQRSGKLLGGLCQATPIRTEAELRPRSSGPSHLAPAAAPASPPSLGVTRAADCQGFCSILLIQEKVLDISMSESCCATKEPARPGQRRSTEAVHNPVASSFGSGTADAWCPAPRARLQGDAAKKTQTTIFATEAWCQES